MRTRPRSSSVFKHRTAVDAADVVDLGPRDRLAVGDDRQRLQHRARQPLRLARDQPRHPGRVVGVGPQVPAARDLTTTGCRCRPARDGRAAPPARRSPCRRPARRPGFLSSVTDSGRSLANSRLSSTLSRRPGAGRREPPPRRLDVAGRLGGRAPPARPARPAAASCVGPSQSSGRVGSSAARPRWAPPSRACPRLPSTSRRGRGHRSARPGSRRRVGLVGSSCRSATGSSAGHRLLSCPYVFFTARRPRSPQHASPSLLLAASARVLGDGRPRPRPDVIVTVLARASSDVPLTA